MRRTSSGRCTPKYNINTTSATRLLTVSDTENAFICGAYRESKPSSASLTNNVATTGALITRVLLTSASNRPTIADRCISQPLAGAQMR
ncbi:hypothetical protein D9M72_615450 [compost metagenome]